MKGNLKPMLRIISANKICLFIPELHLTKTDREISRIANILFHETSYPYMSKGQEKQLNRFS